MSLKRIICLILLSCFALISPFITSSWAQELPDDLTEISLEELMQIDLIPIDVLGSHIHLKGEFMIGYRFMYMQMNEEAHHDEGEFMVMPTQMDMQMHMLEVMYGVTEKLTLMVMMPYSSLSMDHVTQSDQHFSTASQGLGDIQLMSHFVLHRSAHNHWISGLGVSLPTGSINKKDDTPAGENQQLPYPMQLSSGTADLHAGLTYIHEQSDWSIGAHADGQFRLGENSNQYRVGNTVHAGAWVSWRAREWFAPTIHIDAHRTGDVKGADPSLNPHMVPTADPHLQGDFHFSLVPIVNFYAPNRTLEGHRLSLQGNLPVYHPGHGIPLEAGTTVTLGWQWTF